MADPNPYRARLAKKKKNVEEAISEAGTLRDALLTQWRAILAAEAVMLDELEGSRDPSIIRSMVHAISQANTSFAKLMEVGELEARLEALEAAADTPRLRKVS